jgi:short-subunit dehydrogenase
LTRREVYRNTFVAHARERRQDRHRREQCRIAGPLESTSIEEARRQLDVNLLGAFRVSRAVLPAMREHGGYIVNIGSIGGLIAIPYQALYSASKFALEELSESLRMEVVFRLLRQPFA